jgi:3-dehydroquinate dehydratase
MDSESLNECERYKQEIYIQNQSHDIIVQYLRRQAENLASEIKNVQKSTKESLEKSREEVLMLQSDRETHLMDLLNLRLRQRNEEILLGKMGTESHTIRAQNTLSPPSSWTGQVCLSRAPEIERVAIE